MEKARMLGMEEAAAGGVTYATGPMSVNVRCDF